MHFVQAKGILSAKNGRFIFSRSDGAAEKHGEFAQAQTSLINVCAFRARMQHDGNSYSVMSPHNARLMSIFRTRCKEHGIETNPDTIFAYLSAFEDAGKNTPAQPELF